MEQNRTITDDQFAPLRRKAYQLMARRIADTGQIAEPSPKELRALVHELSVCQIELEMQNVELRRAHHDLEAAYTALRDLYDHAPVGYFTVGVDGIVKQMNQTGAGLLGVQLRDARRRRIDGFIAPASENEFVRFQRDVLTSATRHTTELRMMRRDRSVFFARLDGIAAPPVNGAITEYRLTIIDISHRVQLERKLRSTEERYRTVVDFIAEIPVTLDPHGNILGDGGRLQELVGMSLEELQANQLANLHRLLHHDDSAALTRALAHMATTGEEVNVSLRLRHQEGRWIVLSLRGSCTTDDEGQRRLSGILAPAPC